jgi:hypothetical protein
LKELPNVIISAYPLTNELFEYVVEVDKKRIYVYSAKEEDEAVIQDLTVMWYNSTVKKEKVYN